MESSNTGEIGVVVKSENEKERLTTVIESNAIDKFPNEVIDDDCDNDLDYVFNEIGECGAQQMWKYVLIFVPIALSAIYAISFVVTGSSLDYRCRIPECDLAGEAAVYSEPWLQQAIPYENRRLRKCLRYNTNVTIAARLATSGKGGKCPAQIFDKTDVVKCNDFVFKTNEQRLIQTYGIYCEENEYKLALVGTINNIGNFVSMPFTGILSDKFGRLTVLVIGMTGNSIFGILKAFAPNYYLFVLFEFFDAATGTCTYMAAFVLSVEWVSTKYRVLSCTATSMFYPLGEVFLGLLAMSIPSMRPLLLTIYIPGLLIAFYYWLIPESVRWLVVTGRHRRAMDTLYETAQANHVELSDKSKSIVQRKCMEALDDDTSKATTGAIPISAVLRSRVLGMRLVNCSLCWIVIVHCFYGMSVSSTKIQGDDNKYFSFIVVVFAEMPAALICYFLSDRLGRRITLFAGLAIAGIAIIASAYVAPDQAIVTRILFFTGMLAISMAFSMLYIFTAEIWPTSLRNTLMNLCSMIGRIGAMAAPLTPLLAYILPSLPFWTYGGTAVLAAFLVLALPETLNKKLPDSIEEAIRL